MNCNTVMEISKSKFYTTTWRHFMNKFLSRRSQTKVYIHITLFCLYKIQKQAKLIYGISSTDNNVLFSYVGTERTHWFQNFIKLCLGFGHFLRYDSKFTKENHKPSKIICISVFAAI